MKYKNQTQLFKNKTIGKKYKLVGKVNNINQGENFKNVEVLLPEKFAINMKLDMNSQIPFIEKIYIFEFIYTKKDDKNILLCQKFESIENVLNLKEIYKFYSYFFQCSPISFDNIEKNIKNYLCKIENEILYQITNNLFIKNKNKFLTIPAAFKMHHNYYGGLGHHTITMLKLSEVFLETYPFLNKDLLHSGIILHDMAKIKEFDFVNKTYTKEGILLGHLISGVNNIHEEACLLGIQNTEEILSLKHLIISHHGFLEYGAAKKPQISEALLLWFLDDMDAKFNSIETKIKKTEKGNFSEPLSVVDKKCFYKPNLE
ncbi:HD domain-containing protein [Texas Phoenix palm phytoplasma]|uniref:HD domain-containing protein n=1 Tax=Texas Phoenix palm phytoplasma TaxID=176709 RepID=A0ABS5BI12_9MOLU|nr:HD domain-containing protein [Texas Phoenix palm phytoplasma]MBP3059223.1 HD domain-containing protein [Texas Phoenix palm phytoplasma]